MQAVISSFVSWNCFTLAPRKSGRRGRLLGSPWRGATLVTLDEGFGTTAFHFGVGWPVKGVGPTDEEVGGMVLGRAPIGGGVSPHGEVVSVGLQWGKLAAHSCCGAVMAFGSPWGVQPQELAA